MRTQYWHDKGVWAIHTAQMLSRRVWHGKEWRVKLRRGSYFERIGLTQLIDVKKWSPGLGVAYISINKYCTQYLRYHNFWMSNQGELRFGTSSLRGTILKDWILSENQTAKCQRPGNLDFSKISPLATLTSQQVDLTLCAMVGSRSRRIGINVYRIYSGCAVNLRLSERILT